MMRDQLTLFKNVELTSEKASLISSCG